MIKASRLFAFLARKRRMRKKILTDAHSRVTLVTKIIVYSCNLCVEESMKESLNKHEWIIMEILWDNGPLPLAEIERLASGTLNWKRSTYKTYVRRMCESGLLAYTEDTPRRVYRPLLERGESVRRESDNMLSRMTQDSRRMLLTYMIQDSGLTGEETEELKKLIDSLGGDEDRSS